MVSNVELQRDVIDALEWEPSLDAGNIGVIVHEGVVSLTGHVKTFAEKYIAEKITKRVSGVQAVTNDVDVRLNAGQDREDPAIAGDAVTALDWNILVPRNHVQVVVKNGWVYLEGQVDWQFQKTHAEKAVRYLPGVKGVVNGILVKPAAKAKDVSDEIRNALKRTAELEASSIEVETHGNEVILRGTVRSWAEVNAAGHAAWSAPGVAKVDNQLRINEYAYA